MITLLFSDYSCGFMDIIGRGMVARSFTPFQAEFPDVILFTTGVANSQFPYIEDYQSEYLQLGEAIEQCRLENKRLVYFSSAGAVYGISNVLKDERTPVFPVSAYGKHKLLCERVIQMSQVRHLIIRLANLVGHAQNPSQLIPALYAQIERGNVTLYQHAYRDIMHVSDFVSLMRRLLSTYPENDLLLITSGQSIPVVELFNTLQKLMGRNLTPSLVDSGDKQQFSTAKLQQILPDAIFPPHYYETVLERFVQSNQI